MLLNNKMMIAITYSLPILYALSSILQRSWETNYLYFSKEPETGKSKLLAHKARDYGLILAASVGPHSWSAEPGVLNPVRTIALTTHVEAHVGGRTTYIVNAKDNGSPFGIDQWVKICSQGCLPAPAMYPGTLARSYSLIPGSFPFLSP